MDLFAETSDASGRGTRLMNRLHAWRASRFARAAGFAIRPEPRLVGCPARGRHLLAGRFRFDGHLVEAPRVVPWDIAPPTQGFDRALHGFAWLDDLAALGTVEASHCAAAWTAAWISRFGRGAGPGWTPQLTGRRLLRWVLHAEFSWQGEAAGADGFLASVAAQTDFLSRRWSLAAPGLPRLEALAGLICGAGVLSGQAGRLGPAARALGAECNDLVAADGGIASRNPEMLLEVLALLVVAGEALTDARQAPAPGHVEAVTRIAPVLRTLRHADGGLARFHGGDRGIGGRLEEALAGSGIRPGQGPAAAMGFARLAFGRTSLLADAAPPPAAQPGSDPHASALAFELTSGRRPVIVSCGSGTPFGETWHRAGLVARSHSKLCLDRAAPPGMAAPGRKGRERSPDVPENVTLDREDGPRAATLRLGHDGYAAGYGLTCGRDLTLHRDGRRLIGQDILGPATEADRQKLAQHLRQAGNAEVPFTLRFHLHPDVEATVPETGEVSLRLRNGEVWEFRLGGTGQLAIEPSIYLDSLRLKPRATKQIVIQGVVRDSPVGINWTLAKSQDTPQAIRDIVPDDDDLAQD